MGKRAEVFFAEAIQQSSTYEVIAQNLQLIHEKQTLGEFDFFLKENTTQQQAQTELVNAKANYEEKEILYLQRTDQLETPEIEEVNFDED